MKKFLIILSIFLIFPTVQAKEVRKKEVSESLIALTFDDGPSIKYTLEILDILKEHNATATFFIIGENAEAHPEILEKIADAGCEVGNHTWSHKYLDNLSESEMRLEIEKAHTLITNILGTPPRVFRPPGGRGNDTVLKIAEEFDYTTVLWSKDTRDWACPGVDKVISSALDGVSGGDIVLFHDYNAKNSPTPDALRKILPKLLSEGYKTVTVSDLLEK